MTRSACLDIDPLTGDIDPPDDYRRGPRIRRRCVRCGAHLTDYDYTRSTAPGACAPCVAEDVDPWMLHGTAAQEGASR